MLKNYFHIFQKDFLKSTSNIVFDGNVKLSLFVRKFIFEAVGNEKHQINLIRTLLYRARIPDPSLYTKYTLTGLPGAGKFTCISLIKKILSAQCVPYETKDL